MHSKDSPLEEADILMSIDGRSLKHRRPAQVHAQIEAAGVKSVFLTARGVKLPPSVVRQLGECGVEVGERKSRAGLGWEEGFRIQGRMFDDYDEN